jgi:deoxyribonuclease IV
MNKYIGAHVSAAGGVDKAIDNANSINAKAFSLFVKNQRQWNAKSLDEKIINTFKTKIRKNPITTKYILPHAGYLINIAAPNAEKRQKSVKSLIDELNRCNQLGLSFLNIHPGSHLREISEQESLDLAVESIEEAIAEVPNISVILETTAGQGSNLGYKFEHLGHIINKISNKSRIGVCIDTCHTFSAGYNLSEPTGYNLAIKEFEKHIGFEYLKGIHLNDTKFGCGKRKDRHEQIGKGFLGINFFERFMNDPHFDNMPIILETPDPTQWEKEFELLYNMIK